jgi:cobalt-zinc-cadmium efflux system outer membrane protein
LALLLAGCASTDPDPAFRGVADTLRSRAGVEARWLRSPAEGEEARRLVAGLLAQPLDAEAAARIALLNSPEVQADLESLGIAQADLAQATRIANPSFDAFARRPRGGGPANVEVGVAEDLLDVLVQPLRKRIGEAALEETKLRVGDRLSRAVAEAKAALFTLQASEQLAERLGTIADLHQAAFDLAARQQKAGNVADLDLAVQQAAYEQSRIELVAARAQARVDRAALNRVLGVWGDRAGYTVAPELPPLPESDPAPAGLETAAMANRLDLAAGLFAVDLVGRALALKKGTRFFPTGIEIGVSRERDTDRTVVVGPTLRLQIPLFDTGRASIAKLEAQQRQSQRQLEAVAVRARSEVRAASELLAAARERDEEYERVLLPLRARILDQTLRHYNLMLKGVYDVLLARQQEIETEKAFVASRRDYWLARVELERAVGGRLPAADGAAQAPAAPLPPQSNPKPKTPHEHPPGGSR